MDGVLFVSVDQSKIPKILFSRENQKKYIALLKKSEEQLSVEERTFIHKIDDAVIDNFTRNYDYTFEQAEQYVLELHKYHSNVDH